MKWPVTLRYETFEGRESISFSCPELPDGRRPLLPRRNVTWNFVQHACKQLRARVQEIADLARHGHPREGVAVEQYTRQLEQYLLPVDGFVGFVGAGVILDLDLDPRTALIPWEMLDEAYLECTEDPSHRKSLPPDTNSNASRFCERDGARVQLVKAKIGIGRGITHTVRPTIPRTRPSGREFLMVMDPLRDLLSQENDPTGHCRRDLDTTRRLLSRYFDVTVLSGEHGTATWEKILGNIERDDLAGIYFFGHASSEEGEGVLRLADGPLYARQLSKRVHAPLVFLNACSTASPTGLQDPEQGVVAIASAFASGLTKSVVGSVWPLINVQAAASALHFFEFLFDQNKSCDEALREVRARSYESYLQDAPDLSWMAYRLFGEPDNLLAGVSTIVRIEDDAAFVEYDTLFDEEEELKLGRFGFRVQDVLLRAAKRRNLQRRNLVTLDDIVAGLLRVGDLTRHLCARSLADPDQLYEALVIANLESSEPTNQTTPTSGRAAGNAQELIENLDPRKWFVRKRAEFADAVLDMFLSASQGKGAREQISECQILKALLYHNQRGGPCWPPGLESYAPEAGVLERWLKEDVGRLIDENGLLIFPEMESSAREVIDLAHHLAQQRGVATIPNRLVMAAFLDNANGVVARACARMGVSAEELQSVLIASTHGETSRDFGLTLAACSRVVVPMVQRAQERSRGSIDVSTLFTAFRERAPIEFKEWLKRPPAPVDLDKLAVGDSTVTSPRSTIYESGSEIAGEALDESGERLVELAFALARTAGHPDVRSPHLFAAILELGVGVLGGFKAKHPDAVEVLKQTALSIVARHPSDSLTLSDNVRSILRRAVEGARSSGRAAATADDIAVAFFDDGGGVMGDILSKILRTLRSGQRSSM